MLKLPSRVYKFGKGLAVFHSSTQLLLKLHALCGKILKNRHCLNLLIQDWKHEWEALLEAWITLSTLKGWHSIVKCG